jgi:hypothetical protein
MCIDERRDGVYATTSRWGAVVGSSGWKVRPTVPSVASHKQVPHHGSLNTNCLEKDTLVCGPRERTSNEDGDLV